MQDWPDKGQVPGPVHCGEASFEDRQTSSAAQVPMRESIVRQYWSPLAPGPAHVYRQYPARHFLGAPVVPQSGSVVQLGFGRVSTTHVPLLQYLPSPHAGSVEHVVGCVPPSPPWVGLGWQTSFVHV